VVFRGYIDESYDGKQVPDVFTLSCLIAQGHVWPWIEMAWAKVLEDKNAELAAAHRQTISRYHAVDCNAREREFEGWEPQERNEFVRELFKVFRRHDTATIAFSISGMDLLEICGATSQNAIPVAYELLMRWIMIEIGASQIEEKVQEKIALFFERSDYGPVLQRTFDQTLDDPTFRYGGAFTTIAPMKWQDCIPLQPADLVAYETFKNAKSWRSGQKKLRPSLEALLEMNSFGGRSKNVTREALESMQRWKKAKHFSGL
jgi:hypothetical protein